MTGAEIILETEGLTLRFGGVVAVHQVNLSVGTHDLTAIIGPNGAGKTSLFNLLSGRYRPSEGRIFFTGREITGLAGHHVARLGMARSFQITNIFPSLTASENVQVAYLGRRGRNFNLREPFKKHCPEEVQAILDTVGLTEKAGVQAGQLSHGDQRTLEIAVTLACQPKLLLLDEPTSGMSSYETRLVSDLIQKIWTETSIPILFVEHDMSVAFAVAHKVIVMHQGDIFAEGTPEEIRGDKMVQRIYLGEED
ncbi:MAG: ABC transporter ATP-binding protein [Thermodesulfobacteriota bacterium]